MRHGAAPPLLQRQSWLRPIQRLNLALFIDAQHDGVLGRAEVEADNGLQFLGKLRIFADLEALYQVRLEPVGMPDPPHSGLAHANGSSHGPRAPMGGCWRLLKSRLLHNLLHLGCWNDSRAARARSIFLECGHAASEKSLP